jgi:hypothetical protein
MTSPWSVMEKKKGRRGEGGDNDVDEVAKRAGGKRGSQIPEYEQFTRSKGDFCPKRHKT